MNGESDEGNITSILWDIYDNVQEQGDNMSGGLTKIWDVFNGPKSANELHIASSIHDFYSDWADAGLPNPDSVFAINAVTPTRPFSPQSLDVFVESGGTRKAGDGERHAMVGDSIVARLDLGRPASSDKTPTAAFLDDPATVMTPAGNDRRVWTASGKVGVGAKDGSATVTVRAPSPSLALATANPIEHTDESSTVELRLSHAADVGEYRVVAKSSVADSEGNTLVADTTRTFWRDPALPSLLYPRFSHGETGVEVELSFTQRLATRTVTASNLRLDPALTLASERPIIHEDGSALVRMALSGPPPADGRYSITASTGIADTEGHAIARDESASLVWNPEAPVLERVTVSDDKLVTLEFSEPVDRRPSAFLNVLFSRASDPAALTNILRPVTSTPRFADTLTYSIPGLEAETTYVINVGLAMDENNNALSGRQKRTFMYAPSLVTFDYVKISPDGMTLTLMFSGALSHRTVTRDTISLSSGLVLADTNPVLYERGANTVTVKLASPPADGTHTVTAKRGILGATELAPFLDQTREFWWNPEAPRVESFSMDTDGMSMHLTFTEEIIPSALFRDLLISDGLNLDYSNLISHVEGSRRYTIGLTAPPLDGWRGFAIAQHAITDAAGRPAAAGHVRFFEWDSALPSFVSAEMATDGLSVRLEFSEALATVTAADISLGAGLSPASHGHIEHIYGSRFVTVSLASPPAAGEHTVTARSTIRDTTGIAMGADKQFTFTYSPGAPAFDSASISADGMTVTLGFSEVWTPRP